MRTCVWSSCTAQGEPRKYQCSASNTHLRVLPLYELVEMDGAAKPPGGTQKLSERSRPEGHRPTAVGERCRIIQRPGCPLCPTSFHLLSRKGDSPNRDPAFAAENLRKSTLTFQKNRGRLVSGLRQGRGLAFKCGLFENRPEFVAIHRLMRLGEGGFTAKTRLFERLLLTFCGGLSPTTKVKFQGRGGTLPACITRSSS